MFGVGMDARLDRLIQSGTHRIWHQMGLRNQSGFDAAAASRLWRQGDRRVVEFVEPNLGRATAVSISESDDLFPGIESLHRETPVSQAR